MTGSHRQSTNILLEIAGVRLCLEGEDPHLDFDDHYRPFTSASFEGPEMLRAAVEIRTGKVASGEGRPLFDTGVSWSLAREGGDYLLTRAFPALGGEALWTARFPPGAGRVTVTRRDRSVNPLVYPLDQLLLMYLLAPRGGLILHAAGFGRRGRGFAFLGPSGAGKTTLAGLLRQGKGWETLSDDRVIARRVGNRDLLFGTPWPGEGGISQNLHFPLSGLVFLRKGAEDRLERLPAAAALERLLPVVSIPWFDEEVTAPCLATCETLLRGIPAWELQFRPGPAVVRLLEDSLPPT